MSSIAQQEHPDQTTRPSSVLHCSTCSAVYELDDLAGYDHPHRLELVAREDGAA